MNITERFINYARFGTQSSIYTHTHPSTECQFRLANHIVDELTAMGLENPHVDEHCYVYAWLPATPGMEDVPCLGLISHMDTADDVNGDPVNPQIVTFYGRPIQLKNGVVLEPNPRYIGQRIICTDGTSLLGADDKAGVAEIVTAVEYLTQHPELPHGRVSIVFTPDEEIGEGSDFYDIPKAGCTTAYTVDGGELGEVEYENFNAASFKVTFTGVNVHPGYAKGMMKNAVRMCGDYLNLLPEYMTPEHTEGYEGFIHVVTATGDVNKMVITGIIRDHDSARMQAKKELMESAAEFMENKCGKGTVELEITDSYYNMAQLILPRMELIDNAKAAMEAVGVKPVVIPIRGGTDGARLSYMGLPCPNLCTGGANFHSLREYIPIPSLEKVWQALVQLILLQK